MNVLHIDSGITPNSVSRQISSTVVEALNRHGAPAQLVRRDLGAEPIPHLATQDLATLGQNGALQEFLDSDVIVIGAPMYNFGVSSQLKAWIDRVAVAGKTFRYTEKGPEGLAGGKTVIIASSRGGVYSGNAFMESLDFQERYLTAVFRFLGIDDVTFIRAEGVALSPDHRETAIAKALETAGATVAGLALAA